MFFKVFEDLCAQKGVTPTRVSAEIGISKGTVSYWKKRYKEGVDAKPELNTAQKIAEYFGVSVDVLLGRSQSPLALLLEEAAARQEKLVLRDSGFVAFELPEPLSKKELLLIEAYRRNPNAQEFVDRLLGISENEQET